MINKPFFKETKAYFENLCSSTSKIKTFVPNSERALINALKEATEESYPFLVLTEYEGKISGNNQRTLGPRKLTFMILFNGPVDDPEAQQDLKDLAESYGLNVLAKIDLDCITVESDHWLKSAFLKDNTTYSDVEFAEYKNLFGMEFNIELNLKNALKYDIDFWK